MAGFDFEFRYFEAQEPIVEACQRVARARAHQLGISWRIRRLGPRHQLVIVDGNSRRTDLLGYRLERDLPIVAEGVLATPFPRPQRIRLGRGLADLMLRGRHVDQETCMSLRGVTQTRWYYPPYEFECPAAPGLDARLSTTLSVIVAWNFSEIAPEVLLEELHTACELILEEMVNKRSKRLSFSELTDAADKAGLFGDHLLRGETNPVDLLTELKDLRKNVRHRAAQGAGAWLNKNWEDVALLIERLVGRLSRS